jgi:outer membrane lipoprotein-sorting protein
VRGGLRRGGLRARLASAGVVLALTGSAISAHADASGPAGPAAAAAPSLDALLERFAKSPGLQASFTEEKQIALLAVPLKSEGVVHFAPKRGLVRHATKPSRESVLVNDKEVVYWNGKAVQRIPFASSPVVGALARAFALLLAADRNGLEKDFVLSFRPIEPSGSYRVVLEPKGADLKKIISAIELEGHGIDLSLLRVREKNGDVATTHFASVDTAKKYTDAELDRVFKVPPE